VSLRRWWYERRVAHWSREVEYWERSLENTAVRLEGALRQRGQAEADLIVCAPPPVLDRAAVIREVELRG
jgi:hypothetical protein